MATVDGLTRDRMLAIEAGTVVDGVVDVSGHLFLERHDGTIIDAGNVVGPTGPPAPSFGSGGNVNNATAKYIRIAQLDGINDTNGAQMVIDFTGGQNFGQFYNYTATIHFNQRGADNIRADIYEETPYNTGIVWYTRKLSTYVFELWVLIPAYAGSVKVEPRQEWNGETMYDPIQTTPPSPLSTTNVYIHNSSMALENEVVVDALLPATYRGGPTQVKINGVLSSATYEWLTPYVPGGSRTVKLKKIGSTWYITGQDQKGHYRFQHNDAKWTTYSDSTAASIYSSRVRATRLVSGIVSLSGLLRARGSTPDATLVGTLPVGCRPDFDIIQPVEHADLARALLIKANGDILTRGSGWPSDQYLSLDGITFPAAGVATWTPVGSGGSSFGSSFAADSGFNVQFGTPAFWKDPYGFVWFRGLVKLIATVSTDNTRIIDLPSSHRAHLEQHYRGTALDGYAGLGSHPNNGLNWKLNTPGAVSAWISLAGFVINTLDSQANNPWVNPASFANGWARHGLTFPNGSYLLREDGLCLTQGLMVSGTIGTRAMVLRDSEMWPRDGRIIISNIASNGRGRVDIGGEREALGGQNEPGSFVLTQGTAGGWVSLDGLSWVP